MIRTLILANMIFLIMAGCTKCSSGVSKSDYIAKLDAMCAASKVSAEETVKLMAEAQAKGDSAAMANYSEKLGAMRTAMVAQLEQVPQPADDAALLKTFWTENHLMGPLYAKFAAQFKHVAELQKAAEAAAPAAPVPDGERHEGEAAAPAPTLTNQAELQQAAADMAKTQGELQTQTAKVMSMAEQYGFKVCGNTSN